jgi:hypothetical protein
MIDFLPKNKKESRDFFLPYGDVVSSQGCHAGLGLASRKG